jgi:hypothetical protein
VCACARFVRTARSIAITTWPCLVGVVEEGSAFSSKASTANGLPDNPDANSSIMMPRQLRVKMHLRIVLKYRTLVVNVKMAASRNVNIFTNGYIRSQNFTGVFYFTCLFVSRTNFVRSHADTLPTHKRAFGADAMHTVHTFIMRTCISNYIIRTIGNAMRHQMDVVVGSDHLPL